MKLLEGKRALVTGVANRWSIATGIARAFHAHGAHVALSYQGERVKGAVEKLAEELGGCPAFECDASSDPSLDALAKSLASFGNLDALVHCMAYAAKEDLAGRVYETSRSGFALSLDVSAYSLIALVRALNERLADGASLMALTYLGSTTVVPNYNVMGVAKAALEASVRYLAFDLGDRAIRVNAISAGPISTASSRQVGGISRIIDVVPKIAPLHRNVTIDDVGNVATYLASDLSTSVTGDVHFVDSGYHIMGVPPPSAM